MDISHHLPCQLVELGMCYVPQVANVFTDLTVEENLEMGALLLKEGNMEERNERLCALYRPAGLIKDRKRVSDFMRAGVKD